MEWKENLGVAGMGSVILLVLFLANQSTGRKRLNSIDPFLARYYPHSSLKDEVDWGFVWLDQENGVLTGLANARKEGFFCNKHIVYFGRSLKPLVGGSRFLLSSDLSTHVWDVSVLNCETAIFCHRPKEISDLTIAEELNFLLSKHEQATSTHSTYSYR